ncbi:Unknown protein [Striga hermonthica]|uniref:Protein SHORT HYPOCOTYL IN WHITE LIGHT 1 n=1 Tax=Striga hermonthica TaxID=68872 RepID=A0A9N7MRJ6_STRHE|nr:Unknown protein [Striga hermonthica]
MAATIVSLHAQPIFSNRRTELHSPFTNSAAAPAAAPFLRLRQTALILRVEGSRYLTCRARARGGMVMGDYGDDEDDDDDESEDEEGEDRSLDLLIRFVENVFRKVSRKARRAVKSVLPVPISARLVGFAVNGTIILTFMWVLRAFLEVICTLGSVVFVSILLVRGIWTGISYFQDGRGYREDDDEPQSWTSTRPAT